MLCSSVVPLRRPSCASVEGSTRPWLDGVDNVALTGVTQGWPKGPERMLRPLRPYGLRLVVDPRHELAELLAGGLQEAVLVLRLLLVVLLQAGVVLLHPVLGEGAVLDLREDLLHLGL